MPGAMPGAILVVDDHPLYRDALLQVLRNAFAGYELLVAVTRQKPGIKPPTKEGPASAYGSVDVGSASSDTRTNQNTSIKVGNSTPR